MALAAAFLSEDQFACSICLEVFTNPVSTPCGHSFCQACISSYWDGGRGGNVKIYQCPLCKESFRKRPELHINRTLKEITEQFKQMSDAIGAEDLNSHPHHQHSPALSSPSRPGEMPGTVLNEMMNRFQQLPSPGLPHNSLPFARNHYPQSPTRIKSQQSIQNQPDDPPPPYSPPRR